MPDAINLLMKFDRFSDQWKPRVVAELNDYQFKIARLEGDFSGTAMPIPTRRSSCSRGN